MNRREDAIAIVEARSRLRRAAGRDGTRRPGDIEVAQGQLCEIEKLAGSQLVDHLLVMLNDFFMKSTGFQQARAGWEHPSAERRRERERRYTPDVIRKDVQRIATAARREQHARLADGLRDTSHTVRNYLSRALLCEQDAGSILKHSGAQIATACKSVLASPLLSTSKRGRRVDEAADSLVLSVAEAYKVLTGRQPSASTRSGPSRFMQVLELVFELAGRPVRDVETLVSRCKQLGIGSKRALPPRPSRFGPAPIFGRRQSGN